MSDAQRNESSGDLDFGMQVMNNTLDTLDSSIDSMVTFFFWHNLFFKIIYYTVIVAIIVVVSAFAGFFLNWVHKKYPQKFAKCPCPFRSVS